MAMFDKAPQRGFAPGAGADDDPMQGMPMPMAKKPSRPKVKMGGRSKSKARKLAEKL